MTKLRMMQKGSESSLTRVLELMSEHGEKNVTIYNIGGTDTFESNPRINTEAYLIMAKGNAATRIELAKSIINNRNGIATAMAEAINSTVEFIYDQAINWCVEFSVKLDGQLPEDTTLENINKLAKNNLCEFYWIEKIKSLDAAFIEKYGHLMDLNSFINFRRGSEHSLAINAALTIKNNN